jgi:hypothetical protein
MKRRNALKKTRNGHHEKKGKNICATRKVEK